jgi:NAD-dependent dihydropyrimidine dehydrogenase PreA subunit
MNPLPVLDGTRCDGCGVCVVVCPTGCLEATQSVVWLPRPADCVACGACELVCPVQAITVTGPAASAG